MMEALMKRDEGVEHDHPTDYPLENLGMARAVCAGVGDTVGII
jgi:hypothetical protein